MQLMREAFVGEYLDPQQKLHILDVGALDVNGSYRELFQYDNWLYDGMDVVPGNNVDIVGYDKIIDLYDVIISGQTMEHVKRPWDWLKNLTRYGVPRAYISIIAPHEWEEHNFPIDCYRFLRAGMVGLFEYAGIEVIECYQKDRDTIGIGRLGE